jgi:hypothetical protein
LTKEEDSMDNKQMLKQMVQFNKTAFDNGFSAMKIAQEQGEKMLTAFLEQASWLPEEGIKAVNDWVSANKKGCDDFKAAMDDNYKKLEDFIGG